MKVFLTVVSDTPTLSVPAWAIAFSCSSDRPSVAGQGQILAEKELTNNVLIKSVYRKQHY